MKFLNVMWQILDIQPTSTLVKCGNDYHKFEETQSTLKLATRDAVTFQSGGKKLIPLEKFSSSITSEG